MSTSPVRFPNLVGHVLATSTDLSPQQASAYDYVIAANGVFLRAHNPYLFVLMPLHIFAKVPIRGLVMLTPSISLRHARLPRTLLDAVLADARQQINAEGHLVEALYFFALTRSEQGDRFTVTKPPQSAGVGHVIHLHVPQTPPHDEPPVLLEFHTHGAMSAFWSGTDNRDEQGFRFYAVAGRLNSATPAIRLRLGVYGHFWELPLATLFEPVDDANPSAMNGHDAGEEAHDNGC